MKFSERYIVADQTNSQGKPMSHNYLQEREKELAYIREQQQLLDEFENKPKDEEFARRLREVDLKYHPNMTVMKDYHEKRQHEQLHGGLADNAPASAFDPDALAEGTKVEMEHTDDPKLAEEIAKDHLTEDSSYYKKLKEMEEGD